MAKDDPTYGDGPSQNPFSNQLGAQLPQEKVGQIELPVDTFFVNQHQEHVELGFLELNL